MEYFVFLTLATAVIVAFALILYRKSRDLGIVLGIGAFYYWSLYGAWFIVIDKLGGFSGQHYQYLELKLFPIQLDSDYMATLCVYAGFIITLELTLLALMMKPREQRLPRLILRHEPILLAGFVAAIGSYLIIRDKLDMAWALNTSAYWYTRAKTDEWFTLHQVLNRVALIPPAIGLASLAAGSKSRYFENVRPRYVLPGYLVLLAGMCAFTFVLGNKNEVFTALLAGALAYWGSVKRPPLTKMAVVLGCGLWFLSSIDFFRSTPVSMIPEALASRLEETTDVTHFVATSNEAFGAHFSMYGVLANNVPPQFGYSLYSLVCSIVPRLLWPNRPPDIYLYYSSNVGATQNQGYSLHHATGWYLNFGYLGVVLGAVVLGLLWSKCLNARRNVSARSGQAYRLFAIVAPWVFVAGLPPLVRAGPEGYKGLVLESFVIPLLVLSFACRARREAKQKLVWQADSGWALGGQR